MTWLELHKRSEALATAAHIAQKENNPTTAYSLFLEAGKAEMDALESLDANKKSRTFSVTAVSTVSLFYKARDLKQAEIVAYRCLANDKLLDFAADQLRDILQVIWNERAQAEAGIHFYPGMNFSPGIEDLQKILQPEHEDWDECYDVDIVKWIRVHSALEHENLLINHHLTWLLSSQAFLFAAFAIVYQELSKIDVDPYRRVLYQFILAGLSITGVLVAFYIQGPIRIAEIQQYNLVTWWRMQQLQDINAHPPICGEPSRRDRYLTQSKLPIVFVIAWCAFGFVVIGNVIQQTLNTYYETIKASLAILLASIGMIIIGTMIRRRWKNNGWARH